MMMDNVQLFRYLVGGFCICSFGRWAGWSEVKNAHGKGSRERDIDSSL
jgi:hypothetical protein